MDQEINIYVASSCKNNGTPSAKGAIGICINDDTNNIITEIIQDSSITNQKLDLIAIKLAIERFKDNKVINIYSRSEYAVKCSTEWGQKWKNNNWLNVSKKSIKNVELIKDVLTIIETIKSNGSILNIVHIPKDKTSKELLAAYYSISSVL